MQSIMMYALFDGAVHPNIDSMEDAVFVKTENDQNGNNRPAPNWRISAPQTPTTKDCQYIRRFYPWDQNRYDRYKAQNPPSSRAKARALVPATLGRLRLHQIGAIEEL